MRAAAPFTARMLTALVALCIASVAAACSGEVAATTSSAQEQLVIAQDQPSLPFLVSMVDAPERVAHAGLRRVEIHLPADAATVGADSANLVYDERITADGAGHYAIEPVTVVSPSMTQPQREIFEELQRARQGFFFKYRDLRVRDLELFLGNYAVTVVDEPAFVAGVECVEIEVTPRADPRRSYRLAVDPRTGLVLRTIERDATGVVVASTTFLEFTRTPSLEGVEFHAELYAGTPLEGAELPKGFAPARPQILPRGYREVSSEVVELAGDTYVRRVYGDGLENVFFLQREEPAVAVDAAADPVAADGMPQVHAATPRGGAVMVRIAQVGSFCVAEAVRGRCTYFVIGKVSEADVLDILRSAL